MKGKLPPSTTDSPSMTTTSTPSAPSKPLRETTSNSVGKASSVETPSTSILPPVPPTPAINYGEVPPIPAGALSLPSNLSIHTNHPLSLESDPNAIKISIKLTNGKSITRKFLKSNSVKALFAVAIESDVQNASRAFDLISRFPALTLSTCLEKTLEECQLAGGVVLHRWV